MNIIEQLNNKLKGIKGREREEILICLEYEKYSGFFDASESSDEYNFE